MNLCQVIVVYGRLVIRFGQTGIDSILCPCWDRDKICFDLDGQLFRPYDDFGDNLEWFLDVLKERGNDFVATLH